MGFDGALLFVNRADAVGGCGCYESAFSHEFDEVRSFYRELSESGLELIAELVLNAPLIGKDVVNGLLDPCDELGIELNSSVVADNRVLHVVHGQVAGVALPVLSSGAEEVEVLGFVRANRALDHQAVVAATALELALTAEHAALQIALVDALPFAGLAGVLQHALDTFEELAVNERGVAAVVGLVFVRDLADVVPVAEQARHL
nr:hypothetical protein [Microbacterium sp. SORGH_AS_0888]